MLNQIDNRTFHHQHMRQKICLIINYVFLYRAISIILSPHLEKSHTSRITYAAQIPHLAIFDTNVATPTIRGVLGQHYSESTSCVLRNGLKPSHQVASSVPKIVIDLVSWNCICHSKNPQDLFISLVSCFVHTLPPHTIVVLPNYVRPP